MIQRKLFRRINKIMDPKEEAFLNQLQKFKLLFKSESEVQTRGQKVLPKLTYSMHGRYVYVNKYKPLCAFCKRTLKQLASFMAKKLGAAYNILGEHFRLKGFLKRDLLQQIEKKFYQEEVLCEFCGSPETERRSNKVYCLNCNKNVEKVL